MGKHFETEIRDKGRYTDTPPERRAAQCCACGKPPVAWVRIAYDYMRGNDEFEDVCQRHYDMAGGNLSRFFAHMRTKDRFLAAPAKEVAESQNG